MTRFDTDRLYNRLPSIYRIRDAEEGEPLRALLGVIEEELARVEAEADELYDGLFIETCAEWLVPYLGDLVAASRLHSLEGAGASVRGLVANTISNRRRKGTASVMEGICRDSTGWIARAVELFLRLATTQNLNYFRLENVRTPSFRATTMLELLDSPFDPAPHTADVRFATSTRARHNLPNVGVYAWRLQSFPLEGAASHAVASLPDGRYTFDSFGLSIPLFTNPHPELDPAHLAEEPNAPVPVRRRVLFDELEALRQAMVDGDAYAPVFFDPSQPVLRVFEGVTEIPATQIGIARLPDEAVPAGWRRPGTTQAYLPADGAAAVNLPIRLAVDPVLGRLAYPDGVVPADAPRVAYQYGFSADMGSGPYDRQAEFLSCTAREPDWQAGVGEGLVSYDGELVFDTVSEAIAAWNALPPGRAGIISIADSRTYAEDLSGAQGIAVPRGSTLIVIAALWPDVPNPDVQGGRRRIVGRLAATDVRPTLQGAIECEGTTAGSGDAGELIFNGVRHAGTFTVLPGSLGRLRLAHATLRDGLSCGADSSLTLELESVIAGRVECDAAVKQVSASNSILLGGAATSPAATALEAAGSLVDLNAVTAFGSVRAFSLSVSNSIIAGVASAERTQVGCVRFSYMAPGSRTARRYKCQPDLAIEVRKLLLGDPLSIAEQQHALLLAAPLFTATELQSPGLAQLSPGCPAGITTGAGDGSEMGAFHALQQPKRRANFGTAIGDFVPFGRRVELIEST